MTHRRREYLCVVYSAYFAALFGALGSFVASTSNIVMREFRKAAPPLPLSRGRRVKGGGGRKEGSLSIQNMSCWSPSLPLLCPFSPLHPFLVHCEIKDLLLFLLPPPPPCERDSPSTLYPSSRPLPTLRRGMANPPSTQVIFCPPPRFSSLFFCRRRPNWSNKRPHTHTH